MAGEKRTKDQEDSLLNENIIIVDIEGTTTSISFVKDKLFPYVRENLKKYIDSKWEDQEFKSDLEKLKEQAKKDEEDKTEGLVTISGGTDDEVKESIMKNVLWQMDGDRKTGALKQLQGHMWREAYNSGSIKGHVYEDVPESLKSWTKAGKKVYVYSSGSVEAQKLLFGHSEHGDLLEYFTGYFDTAVGLKQEAASYKNILSQIKAEASDVVFLTDIVKEAKAAKEAGLSSIIMIREGNAPLTDEEKEGFRTAKSFLDLPFLNAAKRQKLDTPEVPKEESAPEKMEVSEDVEMTDISDKDSKSKVESNDNKVEPETNEKTESKDISAETPALQTIVEKDEAMETDGKVEADKKDDETVTNTKSAEETKDAKVEVVESEKETQKATKEETKSEESGKTVDKEAKAGDKPEETNEKANADETDKAAPAESKKAEVLEKPVEPMDQKTESGKTEAVAAGVEEAMEEAAPPQTETKSVKVTDEKTETKTEESDKKSELSKADVAEKETENKKETEKAAESCAKTVQAEGKNGPKEEVSAAVDSEKIAKPVETATKIEETVSKPDEIVPKETVKENGTAKVDETSKTETEIKKVENSEGTDAKKTEPKVEEAAVAESKESGDKNSTDEPKAEASAATETKKEVEAKNSEAAKSGEEKESDKEVAKNDTAEGAKDEPAKKVNGTTQNGETVTETEDKKKVHTNGVNEPCTSEAADAKTSTDNSSGQNREAESSTDASAESIKVKKVVDSTVADGAGEPDVVPPAVVVAATS